MLKKEDSVVLNTVLRNQSLRGKKFQKLVAGKKIEAVMYTRSFHGISQESERKKITSETVKTDKNGIAAFAFKVPEKGHYIITFETEDQNDNETTDITQL